MVLAKMKQLSKHHWNISISLGNQLPMTLPWCGNLPDLPQENKNFNFMILFEYLQSKEILTIWINTTFAALFKVFV